MKLWIDDVRPVPEGYLADGYLPSPILSVEEAIATIQYYESLKANIELIDIDHDAGKYFGYGGDYIRLLDWLEETGRNYPIRIHSMNPVGVANMRAIIEKNDWKEIR